MADKEAATKLVTIVANHIAKRDKTEFAFSYSETNAERLHAYALITRARDYLQRQQDDLGVSYLDFTEEVLKMILKDPYWSSKVKSLVSIRNCVGQFAQDLFRQKKLKMAKVKSDRSLIDRLQERDYVSVSYTI